MSNKQIRSTVNTRITMTRGRPTRTTTCAKFLDTWPLMSACQPQCRMRNTTAQQTCRPSYATQTQTHNMQASELMHARRLQKNCGSLCGQHPQEVTHIACRCPAKYRGIDSNQNRAHRHSAPTQVVKLMSSKREYRLSSSMQVTSMHPEWLPTSVSNQSRKTNPSHTMRTNTCCKQLNTYIM